MTREEAVKEIERTKDYPASDPASDEALDGAINTMRKYQKIQEIVKAWREVGLDYDSCDAMDNIETVIEADKEKNNADSRTQDLS